MHDARARIKDARLQGAEYEDSLADFAEMPGIAEDIHNMPIGGSCSKGAEPVLFFGTKNRTNMPSLF
ncbi:MAG: hypothetical protein CVU57_15735 [Deltaproteobacteria bacterium HGW-Deltaproteobacteria-15]|jgi:hypothetical protein|nr:MAG: hypothetical protein CVU57_15735 [Deltaproteobacteria bacterium HGW-Deltaproteobacteria-15]